MEIKVRKKDKVNILDIAGKIVIGEELDRLRTIVLDLLEAGEKSFVLNLAEVPYVDSTGLGEIIRVYISVTKKTGKVKLLNLSSKIHDLLVISELITTFEKDIFTDEETALKSF